MDYHRQPYPPNPSPNQLDPGDPSLHMPIRTRRTPVACTHCRKRKRKVNSLPFSILPPTDMSHPKCGGVFPDPCQPCIVHGRECVYDNINESPPAGEPEEEFSESTAESHPTTMSQQQTMSTRQVVYPDTSCQSSSPIERPLLYLGQPLSVCPLPGA
jgi:hypothetical protein